SGPDGPFTYQWSTGATTRSITVSAPGTYTLSVSSTACGPVPCSKTVTMIPQPPCAITGAAEFCAGTTTTLSGPDGPYTYLWSTGATTRSITVTADAEHVGAGRCHVDRARRGAGAPQI